MKFIILKYLITAAIVVVVSEVAQAERQVGGVYRRFADGDGAGFVLVVF